jgi:hypothetical protein
VTRDQGTIVTGVHPDGDEAPEVTAGRDGGLTAKRNGSRRDGPDAGGSASGGRPSDRGARVRPGATNAGPGPITQEYES